MACIYHRDSVRTRALRCADASELRTRSCRSRLAGDEAFMRCGVPEDAIASKPAPTVVLWCADASVLRSRTCRSRLAGDEAFKPCGVAEDAIAGKPAPTGICGVQMLRGCEHGLVGAGLLAIGPSNVAVDLRTPSPASRLLQWFCGVFSCRRRRVLLRRSSPSSWPPCSSVRPVPAVSRRRPPCAAAPP